MIKYLFISIITFVFQIKIYANKSQSPIDTIICKGQVIKLTSPREGDFNFLWSNGATTKTIEVIPLVNSKYVVESTSLSASYIDTIAVSVDELLPAPQIKLVDDNLIISGTSANKIRWFKNNLILNDNDSDTLKFPLQGVYRTEISNLGACWSSSPLFYVFQDMDTATINFSSVVYPNPSTGYFNLVISLPRKVSKTVDVLVQDINGVKLFEIKQFLFQTELVKIPITLPSGFKGQCIVRILLNGILTTKQVIIQ